MSDKMERKIRRMAKKIGMTAACRTAQEYGHYTRRWYFDDDMTGSWRGREPGYLDDEAVEYLTNYVAPEDNHEGA